MAVEAEWIIKKMENWAAPDLAEEWDNIGLLIGDKKQKISSIMVALDASEAAVRTAIQEKYDFIITHHPLIFNPIKRITADDPTGNKILQLIKNNIGLYAAHTNADITEGGVNDILFENLHLTGKENLLENGLGKIGFLSEPIPLKEFAISIKKMLSLPEIRFAGSPDTLVHKIGLCAGSAAGSRYCKAAIEKKCTAYITGDMQYHDVADAVEYGLCMIDIGHYEGEAPILPAIISYLLDEAKKENVELSINPFIDGKRWLTIT